jgi:hypothetical protein
VQPRRGLRRHPGPGDRGEEAEYRVGRRERLRGHPAGAQLEAEARLARGGRVRGGVGARRQLGEEGGRGQVARPRDARGRERRGAGGLPLHGVDDRAAVPGVGRVAGVERGGAREVAGRVVADEGAQPPGRVARVDRGVGGEQVERGGLELLEPRDRHHEAAEERACRARGGSRRSAAPPAPWPAPRAGRAPRSRPRRRGAGVRASANARARRPTRAASAGARAGRGGEGTHGRKVSGGRRQPAPARRPCGRVTERVPGARAGARARAV